MSKKTVITILGILVSVIVLLPIPTSLLHPIIFTFGLAIIFFTRIRF